MCIHGATALRAVDLPAQFGRICSFGSRDGLTLFRSELFNEVDEGLHGDEHASAFPAGLEADAGERCVPERLAANGARPRRWLLSEANALVVGIRNVDALAEFALHVIAARCQVHRGSARGTVHCALPHPGQNFAPSGIAFPQSMQYLAAPVDAGAAGVVIGLMGLIMAWAIAAPAPIPTPIPAVPPVLAAASSSACAASNWV